jgi:hypothetical protein
MWWLCTNVCSSPMYLAISILMLVWLCNFCHFHTLFRYCYNFYHIHNINAVILLISKNITSDILQLIYAFLSKFGIPTISDRDHIHVYGFWRSITKGLHHAHFWRLMITYTMFPKPGLNFKKLILQWLTLLQWLPLIILSYTIKVITKCFIIIFLNMVW